MKQHFVYCLLPAYGDGVHRYCHFDAVLFTTSIQAFRQRTNSIRPSKAPLAAATSSSTAPSESTSRTRSTDKKYTTRKYSRQQRSSWIKKIKCSWWRHISSRPQSKISFSPKRAKVIIAGSILIHCSSSLVSVLVVRRCMQLIKQVAKTDPTSHSVSNSILTSIQTKYHRN